MPLVTNKNDRTIYHNILGQFVVKSFKKQFTQNYIDFFQIINDLKSI